jgi:excisionase family DNA binding protein
VTSVEKLLTPEEAAELLRLSVYTLQEYARKGVIPAIKVGKVWRFREPELNTWLEKQHSGPSYGDSTSGGHSVARDSASSRPETAQDRFIKHMIEERQEAWRALEEIKKKIKPFNVQELIDEADRERDEKIERMFRNETKEE